MGAELKNTFCLLKDGQAILSQHIGNLEEAGTYADYRRNLELYGVLYEHDPEIIVVDRHPEYLSTKLGRKLARARARPLTSVQHHHAHVAACLAENGVPLVCEPVLGVALDGLGMGEDQTFWGGEFLLADYRRYERLGTFKPVAMLGGTQAIREPWRNTYAHLAAGMGWARYRMDYVGLDLTRYLESRPLATLDAMLATGTNSPLASSCGRLFDAVAAAVGIRRERVSYEGQAAVELEALIDDVTMREVSDRQAYPFAIRRPGDRGLPFVEPIGMWRALLGDLVRRTPLPLISARFHAGLARAIVAMIEQVSTRGGERLIGAVALTGGVFQNRRLLEQVSEQLEAKGLAVLTHRLVPANDGGIALGQAVIAAAQASRATHPGHSAAP
jgi:hydrogenase maturation protein HypF